MGNENKPLVHKIWIMIFLRYEKKEAQKQRSLIPRFSYKFTTHIVFHKTDIIFIKWYITKIRDAETYVLMFYGHQSSLLFVVWFSFTTFSHRQFWLCSVHRCFFVACKIHDQSRQAFLRTIWYWMIIQLFIFS